MVLLVGDGVVGRKGAWSGIREVGGASEAGLWIIG